MKLFLNPNIFILIKEGNFVLWDYKNHQQFEVESPYLDRLLEVSKGITRTSLDQIDQDLMDGGILGTSPYDDSFKDWKWDQLSHIFHVGTSNLGIEFIEETPEKWASNYVDICEESKKDFPSLIKKYKTSPLSTEALCTKAFESTSLWNAFKSRQTCRSFDGRSISQNQLMSILYGAFSEIHGEWKNENVQVLGRRKAQPSGGGVHPMEAYVAVLNVESLTPGIYHYCTEDNLLYPLKKGEFEDEIVACLLGQYYLKGIAAGIFLTACFDRSWWKYTHSRALRIVTLDIGHASQTCLLGATAHGLQTWISGAFHDDRIKSLLNIENDVSENPMLFIGIGHGDTSVLEPLLEETVTSR